MTYREIIAEVEKQTGIKIHHTCWVSEVKRGYGLTRGLAPNSGQGIGAPQCPPHVFRAIENVLRQNGLI